MKKLTRNLLVLSAASTLGACAGMPGGAETQNDLSSRAANVQAEAQAPVQPSAYERGKRALAEGDIGRAIELFLRANRENPGSIDGMNALAVSYDMLGRSDLADRYFAKALAAAPRDPDVLNNVGYALLKRGDTTRAQKYLLEAKALSSENEVILSNIAILKAPSDIQEDAGQMASAPSNLEERIARARAAADASPDSGSTPSAQEVQTVTRTPAESLEPVPVTEVAALPLDEPAAPASPGAPAIPESAPAAVLAPPRAEESIEWDGERIVPATASQMAEAPTVETAPKTAAEAIEVSENAGTGIDGIAWAGERVTPHSEPVQLVTALKAPVEQETEEPEAGPISLMRRASLQETDIPGDLPPRRPADADLIASLPAAQPKSSGPAAGIEDEGEPLPMTSSEAAPTLPPRAAGLPCDGLLSEARVTLVNGNGREGMARRTRSQLSLLGLPATARLQNADRYSYRESVIHYRADMKCAAEALAKLLQGRPQLERGEDLGEDLRVLLGGDLLDFDAGYVMKLKKDEG